VYCSRRLRAFATLRGGVRKRVKSIVSRIDVESNRQLDARSERSGISWALAETGSKNTVTRI
jgi:hypothetical protein